MAEGTIQITGLRDLTKALRQIDKDLPKAVRLANNAAAQLVVDAAAPRVPVRSGRARRSVKARSTRTAARVAAGGKRVPYFGWLDFGGSTGINRSVRRPFLTEGRYIYPAYAQQRQEVLEVMAAELTAVANSAGLETT